MSSLDDYSLVKSMSGSSSGRPASNKRVRQKEPTVKSVEMTNLVYRVSNLSPNTKRALEIVASKRLRVNGPKLKNLKFRIRLVRWSMYMFAVLGLGFTSTSVILNREHHLNLLPSSGVNVTKSRNGTVAQSPSEA